MQNDFLPILLTADRRVLVRAASRLLGQAEAEDAVQEAYLRVLEGDWFEPKSVQAWMLSVVRNLAIDRLRRRNWMEQWLAKASVEDLVPGSTSLDTALSLNQEVARALHLLAATLTPKEGAAVLLHEVFEISHAEIAKASGKSEVASRQQLRRALSRMRQAASESELRPGSESEPSDETVFRLYMQSLRLCNPQSLWAILSHPPISASASMAGMATNAQPLSSRVTCRVVQASGSLGLVLVLDGVILCALPLGVMQSERDSETAVAY